jgi:hypothetical protein
MIRSLRKEVSRLPGAVPLANGDPFASFYLDIDGPDVNGIMMTGRHQRG